MGGSPTSARVSGVLAAALALAGCGLTRERAPTAPLAGGFQVTGTVARRGVAVAGMKVKLYDPSEAQVDSTYTDGSGNYGFRGLGAGTWTVKVSPLESGDLGYVRFLLTLAKDGDRAVVPPFDVDAHGLALLAPGDSASLFMPTFSAPLRFQWTPYAAVFKWMSARVSDSAGVQVWGSASAQATQTDWNGLGNDGPYAGRVVGPGAYGWRIKIHLPNGVHAATRVRALRLR